MDRFKELKIFVAVAEEGGFAAGAKRLQMSPPPVTRAISSLEIRLGVKLFVRSTRYVRLTEAGEQYLVDCRRILSELDIADQTVSGVNSTPFGKLTITAPLMFGKIHVVPCVVEYLQKYSNTQVSVILLDRIVNLLEEGFDAGIRIGNLPDSSMRAVKIGKVRTMLCASPDYLNLNGRPDTPDQLKNHNLISVTGNHTAQDWSFEQNKRSYKLKVQSRLSVTNNDAALAAATAGFGLVRVLSYQAAQSIAEGNLMPVLEDFEPPPIPVHIVHREGRQLSAKLSEFINIIVERLGTPT